MIKWPKKVKRHGKVLAKIYRSTGRRGYRVCWQPAGGRRQMKSFATYGGTKGALQFAEAVVKEIATGSDTARLTPKQARAALSIFDALDAFLRKTGRSIAPLQAVTEYLDAARKLGEQHSLDAAVKGFLSNVATVQRADASVAAEEFLAACTAKTKAPDGKRPQLSKVYAYMTGHFLRRFTDTFKGSAVCDLTKDNLDLFLGSLSDLAPKTRNHYRATIKMFLGWAVKKDYLAVTHRLFDAPSMKPEPLTSEDTDYYRPAELRQLLDHADDELRPIIALCAFAGLRLNESLRLTWDDVFRRRGHVDITSAKSKTRSRRLVEIVPALAEWLRPWHQRTGPLWSQSVDRYMERSVELRESLGIPSRRNGLRHAFCTYHYALNKGNEHYTAQQAGNSPAMIHAHYKGLATEEEAKEWFAVCPPDAAKNIVSLPIAAGGAA